MPGETRPPVHPLRHLKIEQPPVPEDHSCDPMAYLQELSNAGRWGDDDVLGTLNFITPEVRVAAAAIVREGVTVGCSFPVEASAPFSAKEGGMQRFMTVMPNDFKGRANEVAETVIMSTHGYWVTHLDSHNHLFWEGTTYNGISSASVTARGGAPVGDIAAITDGIATRGVLLDIPVLLGVDCLESGHTVTPEELERAEDRQDVRARSGDVVLLRTGYGGKYRARSAENRSLPLSEGIAGWHPRCLPWLHEREVALIGTDGENDPFPSGFEHSRIGAGIHFVTICRMGLWMMDWCNLEELSRTCARLGRYEFLMTLAPLRLAGCTASPLQPLALF